MASHSVDTTAFCTCAGCALGLSTIHSVTSAMHKVLDIGQAQVAPTSIYVLQAA